MIECLEKIMIEIIIIKMIKKLIMIIKNIIKYNKINQIQIQNNMTNNV